MVGGETVEQIFASGLSSIPGTCPNDAVALHRALQRGGEQAQAWRGHQSAHRPGQEPAGFHRRADHLSLRAQ